MTYLEFRDFLLRYLWRTGDPDMEPDVSVFVRLAEGRLNRDLLIEDRSTLAYADANSNAITLPADFAVMRSIEAPNVTNRDQRGMSYVPPASMTRIRAETNQTNFSPVFSIHGNTLLLSGPFSVSAPTRLEILYYNKIPSFETDDASWVEAQYFDLFLYAVLSQTATYLREDPRLAIWKQEYSSALASVLSFNEKKAFTTGPLNVLLPGVVA